MLPAGIERSKYKKLGQDYRTKRMPGNPKHIRKTGERTRISLLPMIL